MVDVPAGASKLPFGAACLVLLGQLVSCYAQDFAPLPALVEAYLTLLSSVASMASSEQCSAIQGVHTLDAAVEQVLLHDKVLLMSCELSLGK